MGFGGIFLAFEQDRLGFGGDAALLRGGPGRVRGVGLGRRVAAEGYAGDPAGDSAEFQIDPVDPFLQRKNQRNVEMIDAAVERLGLPGRRMDRQGIDFVVEAVELVILGIVRPNRGESDFAAVRKGVFPADFQGKGHVLGGFLGDDIGKGEDIPPRRRTVHIEGEPGAFADLQEGDGSSLRSGALGQGDAGRLLRQADILRRNGEGLIRGNQAFQPAAGRMVIGGDGVRCQRTRQGRSGQKERDGGSHCRRFGGYGRREGRNARMQGGHLLTEMGPAARLRADSRAAVQDQGCISLSRLSRPFRWWN